MTTKNTLPALLAGLLATGAALAQHDGDLAVGRSAAGQLKYKPFEESAPCFDPAEGVGLLTHVVGSWRTTNPGFDGNFTAAPALDYYPLAAGANIRLVAVADLEPAFHVKYSTVEIWEAGDFITLGSSVLHRHLTFIVDETDPAYDPFRTLWYGQFLLRDVGSTGYADSAPFFLRFSIVDCVPGDVNGDGELDFRDINPFVNLIVDPAAAPIEQRCAGDVNRSGYVTFADINPFVALLTQQN